MPSAVSFPAAAWRDFFPLPRPDAVFLLGIHRVLKKKYPPFVSVVDPDPDNPYVFGPPGFGSVTKRHGSGSFYHQAKKFLTYFLTFFYLRKI